MDPSPSEDTRPPMLMPFSGIYEDIWRTMVLRIDIDQSYANSLVTKCVSGDFYKLFVSDDLFFYWAYDKSWIVTNPTINLTESKAEITGDLRLWKDIKRYDSYGYSAKIEITILRSYTHVGPATVTLIPHVASDAPDAPDEEAEPSSYTCKKKSNYFRDVTLEVGVTKSVNREPVLPSYYTTLSIDHPYDIPKRTLTIQRAYREAGVNMKINPVHTIIDDSAPEFVAWDDSELHDAMESYFSKYSVTPTWNLWSMLCGTYVNPDYPDSSTLGIMFDLGSGKTKAYGGGKAPYRQGFAIFRNHEKLRDLVPTPMNNAQAEAMRLFLMAYVHEASHTFNLLHPWDRGGRGKETLSWTMYPFRYSEGESRFWELFMFQFESNELVHIRHGDRSAVIMAGDPFESGSSYFEIPNSETSLLAGRPPVELSLSSKGYFDYLEPVGIEIKVRNLLDTTVLVDRRLQPEYGTVQVYIKRPNGTIVKFLPVIYKESTPILLALQSHDGNMQGEDRFSDYVNINYGKLGFYFDEPGEYSIRAVYSNSNLEIPSNDIHVRIGYPTSNEESRIANDFFTYEVGMILYLNGSESPFLSAGKKLLESVSHKYRTSLLGAKISSVLAASEGRPFFRVQNNILVQTHKPNYEKALNLTESSVELCRTQKDKHLNIQYHQLVRRRADYLTKLGKKKEAIEELSDLRKNLTVRGVNESVLRGIQTVQESIEGEGERSKEKHS